MEVSYWFAVFCIADTAGVNSTEYYAINKDIRTVSSGSGCPDAARTKIQDFRTALIGLTADGSWDGTTDTISATDDDANGDGIVVFELTDVIAAGTILHLDGDFRSVFVIRTATDRAITFKGNSTDGGFTLELSGVDPNNVFWVPGTDVSSNSVVFEAAPSDAPHVLAGSFIGKYDGNNHKIDIKKDGSGNNYLKILGGRFLGFKGGTGSGGLGNINNVPTGVDIRAITAGAGSGYVSLVPVLQIHEPNAATAGAVNGMNPLDDNRTAWLPRPTGPATFNLVAAVGDTPSRPGQSNGGLQNFVRFQENWQRPTQNAVNISGAFIQLGRSKYATASQQHVRDADVGDASDLFGYEQDYEVGANGGILGFQTPPERAWGFDVGLLSQSPDLFAQKFSFPSSDNKPDEYFREVSRSDDWVKGLLCAKTEDDGTEAVSRPSGLDCTGYE